MITQNTVFLLLACLGSSNRTKAQTNELPVLGTRVSDAQLSQPLETSDDQHTASAIISVRYRDKFGKLKTVKAKTSKLKRKKPKKSAKLRKNKGRLAKQKLRTKKKPKLSFQTLLPSTPLVPDVVYDYDYGEEVVEYEYEYDYPAPTIPIIPPVPPAEPTIIPVFGPGDHDPHHSVPVLIHEDHPPHPYGHPKPQYPYHKKKHHGKNPGYSHVSVQTPGYSYNIEHHGDSGYGHHNKHTYGHHNKHTYGYHHNPHHAQPHYSYHRKPNYGYHANPYQGYHGRHESKICEDHRPKFGCPEQSYHESPYYQPYHPPPYAPQPKPYYIKDPYHHYHPDPYIPRPPPPLYHKIPPPRDEPVIVHQEADPFHHRHGPVHHPPPILDDTLVPIPSGFVDGRAYGADLVGNFDQATGSFGPSGFYANYYDEK